MCHARRLMQNATSHWSVFNQPIPVCECALALHQEQKRYHLEAVAIDAHRMLHHHSTQKNPECSSGLGWTSAGLPHIQGVHRNLRTNPVGPNSPLQTLTHTVAIVSCITHSTYKCLGLCPSRALYSFRAHDKAERLSPVGPGIAGQSPTYILH